MSIIIKNASCGYEPELFVRSFGFKGSKLSGVWQTAVRLESEHEEGLGLVRGITFTEPKEIVRAVFDKCLTYAKSITGMDVTETFVLNALVPLDFAAWSLYARENGICDFDRIYSGSYRAEKLANIPLITYSTPADEVIRMANEGTAVFKIKLGSDPDGDGDPEKMLRWDMARASEIHKLVKDIKCPYTECGHPVYYFDANGRYDTVERLRRLTDHLDENGILCRTVLLEEQFDAEEHRKQLQNFVDAILYGAPCSWMPIPEAAQYG